ncbi:uroporphyrin-III C-methyltransferase [Chitinophaga skermanii]|uniref:uroporphyrinogen-III C-methyltransferase n=1 Tax=Chitinophaga skermanii TaxID=331697 RepID=A0A327QK94_9BACT|nr:uroporphyrinogen-III C-methyltransferase [Chitinophaga skermanii]RAJ04295.1 uroporphyrin-III C-methyltransferase [Chitinophaga skermanii]
MPFPYLSLVGAGPGDPRLITLKAIDTLQVADVILYDALANDALLAYAPSALKIFVGKRFGAHALPQDEINALIIQYAFSHGHVVRLKGGDPFVFGRATEEIIAAQQAGIPVSIIPGVSSALAVPANCMIPVTSRGIANSFFVITGTTCHGGISEDLRLVAQTNATMIILMGMQQLPAIMDIFISLGKHALPTAIIQEGTTENERMVVGTVSDIVAKSRAACITNPAIIIVGDVVHAHSNAAIRQLAREHTHRVA